MIVRQRCWRRLKQGYRNTGGNRNERDQIFLRSMQEREITGNPLQIAVEEVERGDDGFLVDSPNQFTEKIYDKDFCTECMERMVAFMTGICERSEMETHLGGEKKKHWRKQKE